MKLHFIPIKTNLVVRLLMAAAVFAGLAGLSMVSGCKKERLFVKQDSIPAQPAQFHFFNAFAYDSALSLSVDGLVRQKVGKYGFSEYYPTSSSFNLNNGQPNSKVINISDPTIRTLYANVAANSTFQFQPNTSYLVFPTFNNYDTNTTPVKTIVPSLVYFPEDVYHPFDGTTGVRLFDMVAGSDNITLKMTPDVGQGTSMIMKPVYTPTQPARASDTYSTTQAGIKKITLSLPGKNGLPQLNITYLPFPLDDGKNYSFFATGDAYNYSLNLQPLPKLFLVEDGVPASLKEVPAANVSYGYLSDYANITVINGAYNIPGLAGGASSPAYGIGVRLNDQTTSVIRWPLNQGSGEDVDLSEAGVGGIPSLLGRVSTISVPSGSYLVTNTPRGLYSPQYDQFSQDFEGGLNYTLCLVPDNSSPAHMGHLVVENNIQPDPKAFKLRIINLMGGTTQVDIHSGSPSGPIIANAIPFGENTDYISFQPSLIAQNLYVTAAGSTTPLFQTGSNASPIPLVFNSGNTGTIYLMGLVPGLSYSGDGGFFKPYVYYHNDAYINYQFYTPSAQLYYQL